MYLHDDTGACDVEARPDRNFDAGDAPAADEGCLSVRRKAEDGRDIAAEKLSYLCGHGGERLGRRGALRDKRRYSAQRCLLLLAAPLLGDVARDRAGEPFLRYRASGPLEPSEGAVGADVAVLEPDQFCTARLRGERLRRELTVIGVDELDERTRREFGARCNQASAQRPG